MTLDQVIMGFLLMSMVPLYMSLFLIVRLWLELKAMQKSTHQIQYIDPQAKFQTLTEEQKKALQKDLFEDNL
jgi:hypothetical protein